MSVDTAKLLMGVHQRGGPVTEVPLSNSPDDRAWLLGRPEYVQYVLEENQDNYRKAQIYRDELSEVFGQGLLTSEGDLWRRQHRIIRPMFTKQSVNSFTDTVVDATERMLDRWSEQQGTIDLLEEMEWLTLIIIGEAMFSADMDAYATDIRDALRTLRARFTERNDPTTRVDDDPDPETVAARETLDRIVYELIDERRGQTGRYDDLLSMLMSATDEETGATMDDETVRDQIMTFLLAGHETTAAALTWTWYLLSKNNEIHRQLHHSVASIDTSSPTDALAELGYAKRCVQEGMRIYPPVPVFAREAVERDSIDGHEIPAGGNVLLSQYVIHRDADVWHAPNEYRPDRFAPENEADRIPYSYFPFGGGPRMCIGRQFSLMEARLILGRTVDEYKLELESPPVDQAVDVSSAVTMVPDESIEMRLGTW